MTRGALAFAGGVIAAGQLAALPPLIVCASLTLGACAMLLWGLRLLPAFALGCVYAWCWIAINCNERLASSAVGQTLSVAGEVVGLAEADERRALFDFAIKPTAALPRSDRVRLSWYGAPAPPSAANCVLKVRLQPVHGFANPGGFDTEAWALTRGIDAIGYVREDPGNVCRPTATATLATLRDQLRRALLDTHLSHAGELVALILGDGAGLSREQWLRLQQTGTVHLIVISGLHITMIAMAVFALCAAAMRVCPWALRRFGARAPAAMLAAGLTLGYCALAGFSVPTVRAIIMATCALSAIALQRRNQWHVALALAVAVVHVWQPLAWREPGFWLSFVSVTALLRASATQIERAESRPRRWLRIWLRTQWSMLVVFTPLLLLLFGNAPLISPIANTVAEPLISLVVVPLAGLGTMLLPGAPGLAMPLLGVANSLVAFMWWYLDALVPLARQSALHASAAPQLLPLLGALVLAPRATPGRRLAPLLAAVALFAMRQNVPPTGEFQVQAFDVGQGTAVLVRTAQHTLLVDTGPRFGPDFDAGSAILAPALLSEGVASLDAVIVSHADQDHSGGFVGVAARMNVGTVWEPYAPMVADIVAPRLCRDGEHWRWDGVEFQFLGPAEPIAKVENDRSCVLHVRGARGDAALLPGDISAREEDRLVATHGQALQRLNLLVAAHHGSKTSSSAAFVALARPRAVIFSAAWHSRFGHPHPLVANRYADVGAAQWTSGEVGSTQWRSDQPVIEAYRCLSPKPWRVMPSRCAFLR